METPCGKEEHMKGFWWLGISALALMAGGCALFDTGISQQPETQSEALPADDYRIGVDDRVQVSVWRNPELTVTAPVRPDGKISVPIIGDIQAGGLTAAQVSEEVKKRLSEYIREPNVAVIITELRSHEFLSRVRVTGAVRTPRSLPHRQGMTVLDAVLEAGGLNEFASPNRAKLYRKVKDRTEVFDIALGDILTKGRLQTNLLLRPGDVITVPERLF
jgi:polysaccharide export outer membrane protein